MHTHARTHAQVRLHSSQSHLVEAAPAGVLQVTQVEVQHLLFKFTELDAGLLNEGLVDLLDLFCSGNGAKQEKHSCHATL